MGIVETILGTIGGLVWGILIIFFISLLCYGCILGAEEALLTERTEYKVRQKCPECNSLMYNNGQLLKCPKCGVTITYHGAVHIPQKLKPIALDVSDEELKDAFGEDDD